jgi:hypothetical protein
MSRSLLVRLGLAAIVSATTAISGFAQTPRPDPADSTLPQDVLAAEAAGLVEVRFIANDARSAQVVVTSLVDRPLTIQLPPAFAGVPVLAQQGGAGAGFGSGGIGGAPQSVGGGGAQGGGGLGGGAGGGGGGGGNPFCWVAREIYGVHDPRWLAFREWLTWDAPDQLRDAYAEHGEAFSGWLHDRPVAKAVIRLAMDQAIAANTSDARGGQLRVSPPIDGASAPFNVPARKAVAVRSPTVCLEYGRREPTPRIPYRLVALDAVSPDPKLAVVLGGLATGHVSQKVAQAAAWHLSSGRTWEQLAAEVIDQAGGDPDIPFFSAAELAAAQRVVAIATTVAGKQSSEEASSDSKSQR